MNELLHTRAENYRALERRAERLWNVLLGVSVILTILLRFQSSSWPYLIGISMVIVCGIILYIQYRATIHHSDVQLKHIRKATKVGPSPTSYNSYFRLKDIILLLPPALGGWYYFIDTLVVIVILWLLGYEEKKYHERLLQRVQEQPSK